MDTKARIQALMRERNWTMYELAKRSGVAQTTIANLYVRNNEPSLSTLRALCDAFGVSLSQFFAEDDMWALTPQQRQLLAQWAALTKPQQEMLLAIMKGNEKMKEL